MSGQLTVFSGKATNLIPKDQAAIVTNADAAATLYLGDPTVSSSSNDFSIAHGASRLVQGPRWGIASADLPAVIADVPVGTAQGPLGRTRYFVVNPAVTSTQTDTTPTANRAQVGQVNITDRCILTGIRYLIGATGTGDKAIVALYDKDGNVLANSAKAGTTIGTANTYQALDFESPVEIIATGKYFIGVMSNGNTATLRTFGDASVIAGTQSSATDFSAAPVKITVPTTAAAGAPVAGTY